MAPVSVCHHVSTIGHEDSPTTLKYHSHASGLIGSPTVPSILKDFLEDGVPTELRIFFLKEIPIY